MLKADVSSDSGGWDDERIADALETSVSTVYRTRRPLVEEGLEAGVASIFMLLAPLEGWRHVAVRDRRTAIDFAYILKDLADTHFPKAERITLVQDNLNTQNPASLYKAFPPDEARRIAERCRLKGTSRANRHPHGHSLCKA